MHGDICDYGVIDLWSINTGHSSGWPDFSMSCCISLFRYSAILIPCDLENSIIFALLPFGIQNGSAPCFQQDIFVWLYSAPRYTPFHHQPFCFLFYQFINLCTIYIVHKYTVARSAIVPVAILCTICYTIDMERR